MAITLLRIITLALADAINPCALAVMTMVLVAILLENPEKRHKVLTGGLAFTLAVFVGYFLYGLIIIQLFKSFINFTSVIYPYLTNGLAALAILLGIFNIKDYIRYKPGGIATEMPLRFRPRVKQLIKRVTSPSGAFFIGIFVTLFLLPCTIGPYIIAGGSLSALSFIQTIPWLVLYNLIFIIPMLAITIIVYVGLTEVDKVSAWKDKNIKYIHLVTGLLLVALGIAIITKII
ncbi:MAG: sulfite exporter TauE/SafE family protein [Candidatus Nanoarchaeia archaeon]|nr:sulfite exporter TauE/SafE family protein [Candidatus Nanoarchaeia archaeon]MDD5740776.1 sulfite exporter TauE/SafE family protein [Candidatus Nanoarchaeia archaeon]